MKKMDVIKLIRYHVDNNDQAFRDQAYSIAEDFCKNGDNQVGTYIISLLSGYNTMAPQEREIDSDFLRRSEIINNPLPLPQKIYEDIIGITNAVSFNSGINKFLFAGKPGTGKTESAKQLARILSRDLYIVDVNSLIDSRLGQSAKNVDMLFDEINSMYSPQQVLILFDEIDALALNRLDRTDMREMGRVTSSVLKGLDNMSSSVVLVATTNLLDSFDGALLRRFDKIVDFNRYTHQDLEDIALIILNEMLSKFTFANRNTKLFKKILSLASPLPMPGNLKNIIRSSIAFSDPNDGNDYLRKLYMQLYPSFEMNVHLLKEQGFTTREIEVLSAVPKSTVSRLLSKETKK